MAQMDIRYIAKHINNNKTGNQNRQIPPEKKMNVSSATCTQKKGK